jgi:hypothetical protein
MPTPPPRPPPDREPSLHVLLPPIPSGPPFAARVREVLALAYAAPGRPLPYGDDELAAARALARREGLATTLRALDAEAARRAPRRSRGYELE